MKQYVKNVAYLASVEIALKDLKDNKAEVAVLPNGAEVVSLNLEVIETSDGGITCDIGLDKEEDFFANDIDLTTKANSQSAKQTTLKKTSVVNLQLSGESSKGSVIVRVMYFLPSKILAEYN